MAGYGYGYESWGMQQPGIGAPTGFAGPQNPNSRDSRYRRYLALLQQGNQPGPVAPQRRGGASPYPYVAGGAEPASPTADSIDLLNDQSLYLRGVSDSSIAPPEGPVYSPGYHAPPRQIFARRGYRGPMRPGDEMTVGENGPETVKVGDPSQVQVIPSEDELRQVGFGANTPDAARQRVRERMQGVFANADANMSDEQMRAQVAAQSPANARPPAALLAAATQPNPPLARPAPYIPPNPQEFYTPGPDMRTEGDKLIADTLARQAAERAANQAGADARMPAAQAIIDAKKGTGAAPATRDEVNARRKAGGLPSLDDLEAHSQNVRDILRNRSLERRAAVEEFGTDRPMAVGALRELNRQRALQQYTTESQAETARATAGLKVSQAQEANKSKYLSDYVKANPGATPEQIAAAGQAFDSQIGHDQEQGTTPQDNSKGLANVASSADPYIDALGNAPGGVYVTGSEDRQFTTNADLLERHLDDIEKSPLSPDEKRKIATAILEKANKAWGTEIFGRTAFKERRKRIHSRLRTMAGLK